MLVYSWVSLVERKRGGESFISGGQSKYLLNVDVGFVWTALKIVFLPHSINHKAVGCIKSCPLCS